MNIDPGAHVGLTERYQQKVEEQRGIPVWIRIGLDGGSILAGYIEPMQGYAPHVHLTHFFRELAFAFDGYSDDE